MQELYNATLLQTPEFKAAVESARVLSFSAPVVQHVLSPTSTPSLEPSAVFRENSVDGSGDTLTIAMSSSLGFLFIGTIDCFCQCALDHCN